LEGKLLESKGTSQQALNEARQTISTLQSMVASAKEDVASAQTGAGQREEELIVQLESARAMIQQVAQEYGRLASSTVPKASYDVLNQENRNLQLSINRLQRKFEIADSEVNEMEDLLKISRGHNHALDHIIKGVWEDLDSQTNILKSLVVAEDPSNNDYAEIETDLARIALDESARRNEATSTHLSSIKLFVQWYKTLGRTLLHDYSLACTELSAAAEENQTHQNAITVATVHASTLSTQLEAAKIQTESVQRQAVELSEKLEAANAREASLKDEMAKREKDVKAEKQTAKERLEREREMVKHLQASMEKQRFAEDEMRNEVSVYVISAPASLSVSR
jgi:chromosome segregation ATPase